MSKVAKYLLFSSLINISEMLSADLPSRVNTLPRSGHNIEAALFPLRIHVTLDVFLYSFLKSRDYKNLYLYLSAIICHSFEYMQIF